MIRLCQGRNHYGGKKLDSITTIATVANRAGAERTAGHHGNYDQDQRLESKCPISPTVTS